MKFKIDENLPIEIVWTLRDHGHDATNIPEEQLVGQKDAVIAQVCRAEGRTLVTLDLDFADIRMHPPQNYSGLIVMRPVVENKPHLVRLFLQIVPMLEQEPLSGHLWIVEEHRVRIRGVSEHDEQ